ncbi:MAG: tRNA pseudouridine(13) synthase TruD [Planctomycetes bacterium]|nr:tRNA pseudouridine(13) synthase TruD [Planctomycetota bacterium]
MTLKQSPADFLVEEILAAAVRETLRDRPAALALYRLAKENLTTPQAAAALAKALGVRPGQVAWAGLKDRHARTVQHVTAPAHAVKAGGNLAQIQGRDWQAERLGWLDEAITAAAIEANRFGITVRGLSREACRRMHEAAQLLAATPVERPPDLTVAAQAAPAPSRLRPFVPSSLLFVNYFGDQRFGSARHGRGFLARHLVRGEFEEALRLAIAVWHRKDSRRMKEFKRAAAESWGRWADALARLPRCPERQAVEHLASAPGDFRGAFAALPYDFQEMAVHAYQSHLWNAIARHLVTERCSAGPMLAAEDPFGEMLFPAARAVPAELADLELPVLGRGSALREPWRASAEAVLAEEGVTTEMLRIPGLRRPQFAEVPRRLMAEASGFSLSAAGPDENNPRRLKRIVAFQLPRGSYATVVLRALGQ